MKKSRSRLRFSSRGCEKASAGLAARAKPTLRSLGVPEADAKPDSDNKRKNKGMAHFGTLILITFWILE